MKHYLFQLLIAIDQLLNAFLGGYADETLSSRAYRAHSKGKWLGVLAEIIDLVFFWEEAHCKTAYESERQNRQLPPEFRDS